MGAASSQLQCSPQRPRAGPAGPGHLRAGGGLGKGDSKEENELKHH